MLNTEITKLSAYELSAAIDKGALSPVEIIDAYLDRIEKSDAYFHAYADVYAKEARLAAEAAHKNIQADQRRGPLHGIPVAVKDAVEIRGKRVSGGSKIWKDRVSTTTADLVESMHSHGLVVLGKTYLVEFAFGGWGTNQTAGTPRNPWDAQTPRTPGGSSSGSGVAVAAHLAPLAVGTDTGGSVRLPASFCGLTGLKPTYGNISTKGILPLSHSLDTAGPIARTVRDAALLFYAMRTDLVNAGRILNEVQELQPRARGLRIACLDDKERANVDKDVLDAYDKSLETFAAMGAHIETLKLPFSLGDVAQVNGLIISTEAYCYVGRYVEDSSLELDNDVRPRILAGKGVSAEAYINAFAKRKEFSAQYAAAMQGFDFLATPTTGMAALPLDDADQASTPAYFTRFANLLDLSALALPNGFSKAGMPTSLQLIGAAHSEDLLLQAGLAFQQETDWHLHSPADPAHF